LNGGMTDTKPAETKPVETTTAETGAATVRSIGLCTLSRSQREIVSPAFRWSGVSSIGDGVVSGLMGEGIGQELGWLLVVEAVMRAVGNGVAVVCRKFAR
jgi:outer membrane lipoprotein SlyB